MKKVVSVFLAALMVFSFMAVTVSATESDNTSPSTSPYHGEGKLSDKQAVFHFNLDNGGKVMTGLYVYDEDGWSVYRDKSQIGNDFTMVPDKTNPSKGNQFLGWERIPINGVPADPVDKQQCGPFTSSQAGYTIQESDEGKVVEFVARYGPAAVEEDTFSKVFEILSKIFGAILGVITGRGTDAGIATMKNLFGSLMN